MEFTVSKQALVQELNLLQSVASKAASIPILSTVLLEAEKDRLTLTASDLDTSVRCSCPAKVKKAGSVAIPAKRLFDYACLLPDADVAVKADGASWTTLVCGCARARIAGMSRESFPVLPVAPDLNHEIPAAVWLSMIRKVAFAISDQESRFTLDGSLFLREENRQTMVATDGHRLAFCETPIEGAHGIRVLLPRKAMVQLGKLAGDEVAAICFSQEGNHLFFRIGDRLLVSRQMTGSFPDHVRVLPKEHEHSLTINREALLSAIARVSEFSDQRSKQIMVTMCDGEIKLRACDPGTGEAEENVSANYSGPVVEVSLNAEYLLDFLQACAEQSISILFKASKDVVEMQPDVANAGYRYMLMPMMRI